MKLKVLRARKVYGDGRHNGMTGMARAFGRTFIAFRSGTSHLTPDGGIRVIVSDDDQRWSVVCEQFDDGFDLRDPKIIFWDGGLRVYYARSAKGVSRTMHMRETRDGVTFGPPVQLTGIPPGHWLWHLCPCGDKLFGTAYQRIRGAVDQVGLYGSIDGLDWKLNMPFPVLGNEVYLDVDQDGTLWALVREDLLGSIPTLCSLLPPYTEFDTVTRLPMRLQGPMLKRFPGGSIIVGRQWDAPRYRNLRTAIWWVSDREEMEPLAILPSGGDTSYAAWADAGPGRALLSYYSSHEYIAARPFDIDSSSASANANVEPAHGSDIYLAELSYLLKVTDRMAS